MNLYVGCGPGEIHPQHKEVMNSIPGEWELSDAYVVQDGIKNYDVFNIPYKEVDNIYTSHLLEHISHRKVKDLVSYWYGLLKPKGKLIINVPDLEWACFVFLETLLAEREGRVPSGYYNKTIDYGDGYEHDFLQIFYGSHSTEGEYHKCGFTKESIIKLLEDCGFSVNKLEQKVEAHDFGCLIVEAQK